MYLFYILYDNHEGEAMLPVDTVFNRTGQPIPELLAPVSRYQRVATTGKYTLKTSIFIFYHIYATKNSFLEALVVKMSRFIEPSLWAERYVPWAQYVNPDLYKKNHLCVSPYLASELDYRW